MTELSVSLVLYNNDESLFNTINCILESNLNLVLYLIDNSPTDYLKKKLSRYVSLENVHYIFNNANVGFGAAHNIALRKVFGSSNYHLVINPDILFEKGVLDELHRFMEENRDIGHIMPKIVYPDNSVQYVAKLLPNPLNLIFKRFLPAWLTRKKMDKFQLKFTSYDQIMEVPYLSGCFMFLRVGALKKSGLFDERFFMYPEDIDLTRRIHKHYKTIFYPYVHVVHVHEKASYKSFKMLIIHMQNMIKYFNKWGWFFDKERSLINKKILNQFK